MVVLVFIIARVSVIIGAIVSNSNIHLGLTEAQLLECVWTIVPALILIQIAVPSLLLLYILDERRGNRLRIKAIGHQWYWRYEYSDLWGRGQGLEFDSYMTPERDLERGGVRLLEVDARVVLPYGAHTRVLVGAADVLHSWTVPALGVKADACPGRLNQVAFLRHRPGVFYGQCREICGANHRFMPIALEFVAAPDFVRWARSFDQ